MGPTEATVWLYQGTESTLSTRNCLWPHTHLVVAAAAAAAKLLQSCLTLCDPIDGSPPGSPVPGILQARTLEWVAIFFSNAWKWKVKVKSLSHVWLLATPWTAAYQAPPSMGVSRQAYWSGVPSPSALVVARYILIIQWKVAGSNFYKWVRFLLFSKVRCWCISQDLSSHILPYFFIAFTVEQIPF